jgi:hypothetical protein
LIQKTPLGCALGLGLYFGLAAVFPVKAQTMSYADAISQLATACRNDIAKFCKGVPLGARLKTCFDTNGARMSPQCQQTRGIVYASISRRAAAQRDIGDTHYASFVAAVLVILVAISGAPAQQQINSG